MTTRRSRAARLRITLILMGSLGFLAACSGDDQAAPIVPEFTVDQSDVGPAVNEESRGTTTIDPGQSDVVEPTVLRETKLARVYVATNGNDARSGEGAGQAVASLDRALSILAPGGTVVFQPGTYSPLRIDGVNGSAGSPIRLEAAGSVEFRDDDYKSGAGILIRNSQHIEVVGMTVRRALWGFYIENAHHITVRANNVGDIGQEGIRVKAGSSNVRIDGNTVADTGRRTDKGAANGEGIYIGTGSPAGVDHVKNIVVINNRIMRTTDEAIDVKRPSTNIDIIGNTISDVVTQTSGAIVVHLNGDQGGDPKINVERNVIRNVTRSSPYRDGNCIVVQVTVRIVNNVLQNCQHRGIFLRGNAGTATVLHNTLFNTGSLGSIVNEGRGMNVLNANNLGADGDANRSASADIFVDANSGNFRLRENAPADLRSAPNKGVTNDVTGARRPGSGTVTFGAYESATSVAPATTTTTSTSTTSPPTTAAAVGPVESASPSTKTTAVPSSQQPVGSNAAAANIVPTLPSASSPQRPATAPGTTASRSADPATSPFVPGRDDTESPLPDQASCFDSLVCEWAPFL